MFLKSVWNLSLCISFIIVPWESVSAFYIPVENELEIQPAATNLYMSMKPLLSMLKEGVKEIYDIIEAKDNEMEQINATAYLAYVIDPLPSGESTDSTHSTGSTDSVKKMIELKAEELQNQITANTATIEDLKSKIEKLVHKNDPYSISFEDFLAIMAVQEALRKAQDFSVSQDDGGDLGAKEKEPASESQDKETASQSQEEEPASESQEEEPASESQELKEFQEFLEMIGNKNNYDELMDF